MYSKYNYDDDDVLIITLVELIVPSCIVLPLPFCESCHDVCRAEGQCEQIVYGGCDGTANLFESKAECEAACPPQPVARPLARRIQVDESKCSLP